MILIYLLKVSACTALFFAVYHFLLARLTFFNLNRVYLLLMLVLSFSIPALTIESQREVLRNNQEVPTKIGYTNDGFTEQDTEAEGAITSTTISWNEVITYVYCSFLAFFILRMFYYDGADPVSVAQTCYQ